jgi:hypothetical protein
MEFVLNLNNFRRSYNEGEGLPRTLSVETSGLEFAMYYATIGDFG